MGFRWGDLHPSGRRVRYWHCEDISALQQHPRAGRCSANDRERAIVTHELQVIAGVTADVFHDVAVGHPFGDHGEPPILKCVRNADEIEDVGMGQVLPYGNFFAEVLYCV